MSMPASARGHGLHLVGRASERAELERLPDAVRGGESRTLVVIGEPGIGKTAPIRAESSQRARLRRRSGFP